MLDWDSAGRSQIIDVIDVGSNIVLDTRTATAFMGGQYWVWQVNAPVRIRVTRTGAFNGVVSAVFLDPQ
jgi:hypothetical protein